MTVDRTPTTDLLSELEQVVETNLNRHLATAKEWFPHEYVPWSQGTDYDGPLGGQAWAPEQSRLPEVARTSLIVNLLTEDNLPSYHHEIATMFGRDGAWGSWVHRWTAEEGRHGIAIRDYLLATRAVDRFRQLLRRQVIAARHRLCVLSGARHPGGPPQHRTDQRRPGLRPAAGQGRGGREPAHGLLPEPARRRLRDRAG